MPSLPRGRKRAAVGPVGQPFDLRDQLRGGPGIYMRTVILVVAVFAAVALTAQSALAVNVHWKKGSPQFHDNGLTLTETGTLAGLGTGDLSVFLSATANVNATCSNPGTNGTQAPGQNPAPITVASPVTVIPGRAIHEGNAPYTVTTASLGSSVAGASDCPNSSWTENINDLAFTSATLNVTQGGVTVFQAPASTCTLTPLAYPSGVGDVTSFSCPK